MKPMVLSLEILKLFPISPVLLSGCEHLFRVNHLPCFLLFLGFANLGVCNNLKNPCGLISKGLLQFNADWSQWVVGVQVGGDVSAPFSCSGTQAPSSSGFIVPQDFGVS